RPRTTTTPSNIPGTSTPGAMSSSGAARNSLAYVQARAEARLFRAAPLDVIAPGVLVPGMFEGVVVVRGLVVRGLVGPDALLIALRGLEDVVDQQVRLQRGERVLRPRGAERFGARAQGVHQSDGIDPAQHGAHPSHPVGERSHRHVP